MSATRRLLASMCVVIIKFFLFSVSNQCWFAIHLALNVIMLLPVHSRMRMHSFIRSLSYT